MELIDRAVRAGRTVLSEFESKQVLAGYGIPITKEVIVANRDELLHAVDEIGFPMVLKGCSPEISHKSEQGLVRVDIRNRAEAEAAFDSLKRLRGRDVDAAMIRCLDDAETGVKSGLIRGLAARRAYSAVAALLVAIDDPAGSVREDAFRALGGIVSPPDPCRRFTGKRDECVHLSECGLRPVWSTVKIRLEHLMDQVPLSTLLGSEQSICGRLYVLETESLPQPGETP